MAFKNKAKRHSYVLQNIRKEYEDLGYAVFFKYKKQLGCLEGHTLKHTPIDNEDKLYLKEKKKDFKNDIKDYIKISSGNTDKKDDLSKRNQMILNMKKKGLKNSEIANFVGMTRARITQIINENKKR
jgi:DNA-directed RNA polymerase specialized sigma subunit